MEGNPMKKIVIVTGSVRPNSANAQVVSSVTTALAAKNIKSDIADLKQMNLPFFDAPVPPSSEEFRPEDEAVIAWTNRIATADGVVFVTPEYNHTMSPVQLNAIDWVGKEWKGKPVALIGYGWTSGGAQAHDTAREALEEVLGANVAKTQANLFFTKDINPDGTSLDGAALAAKIDPVLDELLASI